MTSPGSRDPVDQDIDEAVAGPWRRAAVELDDLRRARLAGGIEARLDARAHQVASGRARRWAWLGGSLVLAVGGVVGALVLGPGLSLRVPGGAREGSPAAPVSVELVPYIYAGPGARAEALQPSSRLVVPAGARVRATVGMRARLTLVGPGALSIRPGARAGDIEMALDRGALYVDYDGSSGGVLRVRSPGAVTTVVGTLFAVEVRGTQSRVAVTRGHVRTEVGDAIVPLGAGTAWDPEEGTGAVVPVPVAVAAALSAHDASLPPPVGEFGVVEVGARAAAASDELTLDGRPLGDAPLIARVGAGRHLVGHDQVAVAIDVASGARVRLESARGGPEIGAGVGVVGLVPASASATGSVGPTGAKPMAAQQRSTGYRSATRTGAPVVQALRSPAAPLAPDVPAPPDAAAGTPEPLDLERLYARAEDEMRAGRRDEARRSLLEIVAGEPASARAEHALLDLARLALAEDDPARARVFLRRLPERLLDSALAEPADHLRCSTERRAGNLDAAADCFAAFRARHPRSPHDAEALALLAARADNCARALPLLDEYLRRYPRGSFAADAKKRLIACCPTCR